MKYVYKVEHTRNITTDDMESVSCTKIIGFYSTRGKAKSVIEKFKSIKGFKDYPNDFVIEKCEVDFDDYIFE